MDAFAVYRLPHADHCSMVCQDGCPATLSSVEAIGSEPGFVIAPFTVTDDSPIVMLRPDQVCVCTLDEVAAIDHLPWYHDGAGLSGRPASRDAYHQVFGRFHRVFSESGIQKLVLARCADVEHHGTTHPVTLFVQACKAYPEAFVTLFSAPQCGTWLVATPEVLLSCHAGRYHTMALAGTMRATGSAPQWSDKNLHEQQYVTQYIESCLARYSDDIQADGPYTTRAGILEHLRTDFAFTLTGDTQIGAVLHALHPTPAVCGVPKREAHQFILDNEDLDRSYYSGFSGPVNLDGDTAMFVSLRCMRILDNRYRLFAGGGILPQSVEQMEWDETAAKMHAMLSLIDCTIS